MILTRVVITYASPQEEMLHIQRVEATPTIELINQRVVS